MSFHLITLIPRQDAGSWLEAGQKYTLTTVFPSRDLRSATNAYRSRSSPPDIAPISDLINFSELLQKLIDDSSSAPCSVWVSINRTSTNTPTLFPQNEATSIRNELGFHLEWWESVSRAWSIFYEASHHAARHKNESRLLATGAKLP